MNSQLYSSSIQNQNVIDNFLSLPAKLVKNKFKLDDAYYQSVKRFFQNIKKNNYKINDKFTASNCGRNMGVGFTIQKLSNELRSEVFKNNAYDIDIVNCSFNIAKYIVNTYFNDKKDEFKTLFKYTLNRKKFLKYKFDKLKWIEILFSSNPKTYIKKDIYDNEFNRLILEISMLQDLLMENIDLFNYEFKEDANKGSKVSYIIFQIENQIIQKIIKEFKSIIISPIFDGVIISKDCDLENVLIRCNEIGSKFGVEFINKEFPQTQLDLDCPPKYDDIENKYNEMKLDFEKNHFIIENPLIYVKEYESQGQTQFIFMNKGDFKDNVATYNYEDKNGNETPFFNDWLKDKDRRSYKTITWIPSLDESQNLPENYNTFKGFISKLVNVPEKDKFKTINEEYDGKSVIRFINHLNLLVNNESEGLEYLKNYIADMFQNPTILPEVAILFKSKQGSGKDLMTSILGSILGRSLIHKDAKMENIVGNFNEDLQNKLIIQLNEVCGNDGRFNREILKDIITTEQFNINPKYGKKLKCNNYARIFAASNNKTPLNIPQDDRRYVVFKCADPILNEEYYNKLVDIKKDKRALNSIYSYFMNLDITDFKIKNRFISQEYKNLQSATSNPFHEFLYQVCNNKDELLNIKSQGNFDYIKVNDIYAGYETYLSQNSLVEQIKTNRRDMKANMLECEAIETKAYYGKIQHRVFKLDFVKLKLHLEKHYIKDFDEDFVCFDEEEELINYDDDEE